MRKLKIVEDKPIDLTINRDTCCSPATKKCYLRECKACSEKMFLVNLFDDIEKHIVWFIGARQGVIGKKPGKFSSYSENDSCIIFTTLLYMLYKVQHSIWYTFWERKKLIRNPRSIFRVYYNFASRGKHARKVCVLLVHYVQYGTYSLKHHIKTMLLIINTCWSSTSSPDSCVIHQ